MWSRLPFLFAISGGHTPKARRADLIGNPETAPRVYNGWREAAASPRVDGAIS